MNLNVWFLKLHTFLSFFSSRRPTKKKLTVALPFTFQHYRISSYVTQWASVFVIFVTALSNSPHCSTLHHFGMLETVLLCLWSWVMIADDNWRESLATSGFNEKDWTCWSIRCAPHPSKSFWTWRFRKAAGEFVMKDSKCNWAVSLLRENLHLVFVPFEFQEEKISERHWEIKWKVRSPGGMGKKPNAETGIKQFRACVWAEGRHNEQGSHLPRRMRPSGVDQRCVGNTE